MQQSHPLLNIIKDKSLLSAIAEKYGTPLYIYSEERLIENVNKINSALSNNFDS